MVAAMTASRQRRNVQGVVGMWGSEEKSMAEDHISTVEWIIANTINEAARGDPAELATHIVAALKRGGYLIAAITPGTEDTALGPQPLGELRGSRCVASGIPGDCRCRPRAANRRSTAGKPLHDAPRTRYCAVSQLGECHGRTAEPRARRHPAGAGALSHLLRHQHG